MNIAQVSGQMSGRAQGLLTYLMELYPMFRIMEYRHELSTHLTGKDTDASTGTAARAEGSAAQSDPQAPVMEAQTHQLYSREITIDRLRTLDANLGAGPALLLQFADRRVRGLGSKMGAEIQNHYFTGTFTNNQMLGFSNFIKDANAAGQTARLGFSQAELASMNVNANLKLDNDDDKAEFVELIIRELENVPGANGIMVNTYLGARIYTIAAKAGAAGETRDSFGQPVKTAWGKPLISLPTTAISQTESDGVNGDCTSLWIARFAEELGVCMATNSGFLYSDFENLESAPEGKARMEFYQSLICERTDALRRISRIRL